MAYFTDVADVPAQAARMVDFAPDFANDLASGALPTTHSSFPTI